MAQELLIFIFRNRIEKFSLTTLNKTPNQHTEMQSLKSLLANPYVMAGLIGGATYFIIDQYKPDILQSLPFASPMNLGIVAAVGYLLFLYYRGSLSLPLLGKRGGPMPVVPVRPIASAAATLPEELGARTTQRAMTTSMSDLLGPDQF